MWKTIYLKKYIYIFLFLSYNDLNNWEATHSPKSKTRGFAAQREGEQFILALKGGWVVSACLQWCRADFFWQAYECPQAKGIRAVEAKGRERIWPGETLQHDCTGAIKNITRDECNHVYLAAEKARCVVLLYSYSFGHCRRLNQSRKMLKDEKKQGKLTLGFDLADGAAGEGMKHTTSVQKCQILKYEDWRIIILYV